MSYEQRLSTLLRLAHSEPYDIDLLLKKLDSRAGEPGKELSPCNEGKPLPDLPFAREEAMAVGVSVTSALSDPLDVAARLCAFSVEQDVEIIVLSQLDYSGLERFGFRTERVTGQTEVEVAACLDELKQFWRIELVIPACGN